MQATPSTSSLTSPSRRSTIAETVPRLRLSCISGGIDQSQRHIDHGLDVVDGDVLVGRVDLGHPVREMEAREAARLEDVRVRAAAGQGGHELVAAARERTGG